MNAAAQAPSIQRRARVLYEEQRGQVFRRTDRMFAHLLVCQWVVAVIGTLLVSPYTWAGPERSVHPHVAASLLLGGLLTGLPVWLAWRRSGGAVTRHAIAVAQLLWSGLLIHLSGGRIEMHFHVFGSLALIAIYRDWKALIPAMLVTAVDHLIRGLFWPESVYGLINPEWWRFLEHAFWVAFEGIFLLLSCHAGAADLWKEAGRRAENEALSGSLEDQRAVLEERSRALVAANLELETRLGELHKTQDQLMQADRLASVGRLAAGIGHEINNPLSYTIANLEDIRAAGLPAPLSELAHEALDGANRVRRIVRDLKTMSRSSEERRIPVDVHELLESMIRMASNEIRHRGTLVREYRDVPAVLGDPDRLCQVFLNLITNASQALIGHREGGHEIRIRTARAPADRVAIEIEDTGEGMTPDQLRRAFDPFFTSKPVGVGTGLGLSICHGIVSNHAGEISVVSTVGVGTCFTVVLPAARDAVADTTPAPPERRSTQRAAVLVVDDEPALLAVIRRKLMRHHHHVETAEGTADALAMLARGERFDAIVCDVMMPGLTGVDLYRQIAAGGSGLERRIVFLTGGAFTPETGEFLRHCANPVLDKPIDFHRLNEVIHQMSATDTR